ncbi:MAG: hypothetical protein Q9159_006089 [Coniocarpon cinnabarinum]
MPSALILGATGYLGLPLAQSLLRSGNYSVYGLARNSEKAKTLTKNEITPVIGDVNDPSSFSAVLSSAPIDLLIDATSAYESASGILKAVADASKSRMSKLGKENAPNVPKIGFVYISGSWVHGSVDSPVSETIVPGTSMAKGKPAVAVGWRPAHEQAILSSQDVLDVAIVRPHQIYGRSCWVWSAHWGLVQEAAKSGSSQPIKVPADVDSRPGIIHVDDVVSGVHGVADRVHGLLGSWPVFDLVGEHVTVRETLEGVKKIMGVKAPLDFIGNQGNPFFEALGLVNNNQSSRTNLVFGWQPKRKGFLLNLETYVKAWTAFKEEQK